MTNAQVQKKLNQLRDIANELNTEAKRRYGPSGSLFYEAEGSFHLMAGDADAGLAKRQSYIRVSSEGHCTMGCGAW